MSTPAHTEHVDHGHTHAVGCGHVAVPHADHVDHIDYVHDGHRLAVLDGHVAEH